MAKPKETMLRSGDNVIKNTESPDNTAMRLLNSSLQDAVLGFNPGGPGTQLSQVDTIFVNMRWYLISNMRQPLNEAYCEIGVVKTVVDVPVEDAYRGGFNYHSKQLSPDNLKELHSVMTEEDDLSKMAYVDKWDRLFGGAGLVCVTGHDPERPFKIEEIKEGDRVDFRDADMWELFWDRQNIDGDGEPFDTPATKYFRFYGHNIHRSRVMIRKGIRAPSFIRPRLRGWGLSVVEILVRSINQYLKANDLTFEVLDEFKVDIYKIKNLVETLASAEGVASVQNRIRIGNLQKNYQNAVVIDADDDLTQKQISFAGLSDVQIGIRMQIASDLRMPLTKVFGTSAQGFSSGEDDIENYNAMVESSVRTPAHRHLIQLGKIRCQQIFGFAPDDLEGEFLPLRILGAEQQENVKNAQFQRIHTSWAAGGMSQQEYKDGCNKAKLFPIQIDAKADTLAEKLEQETEMATQVAGGAKGEASGKDKGFRGAYIEPKKPAKGTKVAKPAKT
jgi:phage-related protein (TIGR01555 family)